MCCRLDQILQGGRKIFMSDRIALFSIMPAISGFGVFTSYSLACVSSGVIMIR